MELIQVHQALDARPAQDPGVYPCRYRAEVR